MTSLRSKGKGVVIALVFILILSFPFDVSAFNSDDYEYLVGAGSYDITGPAAEVVMMGYADSGQTTAGIHQRLRSRAFIAEERASDQRVVLVSADLGQLFHSVKQGVINKLNNNGYGKWYNEENVMLSATHTHGGPGGYAHRGLYNLSSYGFHEKNYETIVNGIYESIVRAHRNLQPGSIEVNQTQVDGISANRSKEAYKNNPAAERSKYDQDVDTTMTQLHFRDASDRLLGVYNWFPVHGVSMSGENHLITGDNKGYASYLLEEEMGGEVTAEGSFVAAFAQAHAGDVTPNIYGDGKGHGDSDQESTQYAGRVQYEAAKRMAESTGTEVSGGISTKHKYIDMQNVTVASEYADGTERRTYPGALGYSFGAGTEDGRGPSFFQEGMTQPEYQIDDYDNIVPYLQNLMVIVPQIGEMSGAKYPKLWEQHAPKPVLLAPSKVTPDSWTPDIVPVQMVQIGQVSIVAVPAEVTTMAGRRMMEQVQEKMDAHLQQKSITVISGLSNAYSSYVSTPEEYDKQHYEGASTLYGKWTLGAYLQEFDRLTDAIITGNEVEKGKAPKDLSDEQVYFPPGVLYDLPPWGKSFGDVKKNVESSYAAGDKVSVQFWAGHPNNNFRTQSTYLEVQRLKGDNWVTVADDHDWETTFQWERKSTVMATSFVKITWQVPSNVEKGTYRIVHYGSSKSMSGKVSDYKGKSSTFTVK
ncbi:neutral/alkaline ceramidase [Mechercharimyces sp. CAU 1602]|uniref:neutral/alkaline ceramidase n=1 Tax=Mechercharimyces sp. CAU 1602 TaxID=2973933 RepID=UPI002163110B|nr:neutral/alkaline ceramidase [Mechercharimyces sp. CAU 1602]MCS1349999.1 neutral/alkaline ceramidase [Mechercharimyces sp. CAU 1602]